MENCVGIHHVDKGLGCGRVQGIGTVGGFESFVRQCFEGLVVHLHAEQVNFVIAQAAMHSTISSLLVIV